MDIKVPHWTNTHLEQRELSIALTAKRLHSQSHSGRRKQVQNGAQTEQPRVGAYTRSFASIDNIFHEDIYTPSHARSTYHA